MICLYGPLGVDRSEAGEQSRFGAVGPDVTHDPLRGASLLQEEGKEDDDEEEEEEEKEGVPTKRSAVFETDTISETGISNILQSHRSCSLTSA